MTDTANNKEHYPLDPDFMIDHARALLRVAQELARDNPSPASDRDFFSSYGHTIAKRGYVEREKDLFGATTCSACSVG